MRVPAVFLVLAALAGCSAGTDAPERGEIEGVESFTDLSHDHLEGPQSYAQDPPVGGPHNARWLACDVYDGPVPNELAVHAMEHGGVWITYDPVQTYAGGDQGGEPGVPCRDVGLTLEEARQLLDS